MSNHIRISLTALLLSFICTLSSWADGVTLTVKSPSVIEVGEKFKVQFTVNTQNVSGFTSPTFKGFEVVYGPSTSTQSSFQMINGRTSQSSSVTYTFILVGDVPGTYNIGSASIQAEGSTVKSKPFSIKVLSAGTSNGSGANSRSSGSASGLQTSTPVTTGNGVTTKDLFMTATASRTTVYEQEAILLTYKVYSTVNLVELDGKLPTLDGFQIQEVDLPHNKQFHLENYGGRNYQAVVWSQYLLFPQKVGTLTIPSITYQGVVHQANPNIDPFDAIFNGTSGVMELKKQITTPTLTIKVKELPAQPDGYSGAVGNFSLSSNISHTEIDANEAVTLKLTVSGTGNMKLISEPEINFPNGFETYDTKVNDNFQLTSSGLSGSKEFEYLFVPRHEGNYTIPAIEFVYFDTNTHNYRTATAGPFSLKVNKSSGNGKQSKADYSAGQQDVEQLNKDIHFIKTGNTTYHQPGDSMFGSLRQALAYLIPLAVFIVLLIAGRSRAKSNANVARLRDKKANKVALKRMKTAKALLDQHNQGQFYDEVLRTLWGYTADKLNLPKENLNKETIHDMLLQRGASEERVAQLLKVQDECEFARYAPGDPSENMSNIYNNAIAAITEMEEEL